MERGNKHSTGRRAVSNLNAVPDGVPNGVFSVYIFCPTVLTVRRLFYTDKAALQGKRYIVTPSAAAAAPPLKGREYISRLPCAGFPPRLCGANLGSPVYLKQECLRRFAAKTFCDWCFAPTAGGFTALATINDGASLLIEGELDFRLVYKPKRLRGCIPDRR